MPVGVNVYVCLCISVCVVPCNELECVSSKGYPYFTVKCFWDRLQNLCSADKDKMVND